MNESGNDSRDIAAAATSEVSDEDYAEMAENLDVDEKESGGVLSLSEDEEEVIRSVAALGFEFLSNDEHNLRFRQVRASSRDDLRFPTRRRLPRSCVGTLLGQLGETVVEHPSLTGLIIPTHGYVEVLLRSRTSSLRTSRIYSLGTDDLDCLHRNPGGEFPTLAYRPIGESQDAEMRLHLSGRGDEPCLEISNASPLFSLYYARFNEPGSARLRVGSPFMPTLKLDYRVPLAAQELVQKFSEIARSFLYELDVRNELALTLDARALRRGPGVDWRGAARADNVRYPRTRLQYEVSSLFGFASQAIGDAPLAFLSYYQTLEYFIPAAVRQSALKDIKRELRDPMFDETSNECLLRIVAAAEGSISAAESTQFRILVNEYARKNRLDEFFRHDWGNYFTRQGPIKGVEAINIKNTTLSLPDQVADRVYKIRNRIVHAKDDPKYGNARVLLPRSAEADALPPDVLLVRLLATEAIAASQVL